MVSVSVNALLQLRLISPRPHDILFTSNQYLGHLPIKIASEEKLKSVTDSQLEYLGSYFSPNTIVHRKADNYSLVSPNG